MTEIRVPEGRKGSPRLGAGVWFALEARRNEAGIVLTRGYGILETANRSEAKPEAGEAKPVLYSSAFSSFARWPQGAGRSGIKVKRMSQRLPGKSLG